MSHVIHSFIPRLFIHRRSMENEGIVNYLLIMLVPAVITHHRFGKRGMRWRKMYKGGGEVAEWKNDGRDRNKAADDKIVLIFKLNMS